MTHADFILTAIAALATLGGLVVVVISIIAYLQVDDKVSAQFDKKYAEHQRSLNQQSAQWANGIRLWTQAAMTADLTAAPSLMKEALKAWPDAPGTRTEMLRRLYEETESAYILDLIPDQRWNLAIQDLHSTFPAYLHSPVHIPFPYLEDCLEWLTLCDEHERGNDPIWLDWVGAKIYAMFGKTAPMFRYLSSMPQDNLSEPQDRTALVLMSSIQGVADFHQLDEWWQSRFHHAINGTTWSDLAAMRSKAQGQAYPWLVAPTHPLSQTRRISIGPIEGSRWDVQWGDNDQRKVVEDLEALQEFVNQQWILCAPIPRFPRF